MRKTKDLLFKILVLLSAIFTLAIIAGIIGFIFLKGIPHISIDLIFGEYNSQTLSLFSPLITTLQMMIISLLIAIPIGVSAAIYLTEYSKQNNFLIKLINLATETLAGIPSIIFGLFGMIFFVGILKMGTSILAGALTLTIMILPIIMRTTEEAINSVPNLYREGSYGLGANKINTIIKIVIPNASKGILAGIILSIGRIVGESAALIFTSGTNIDSATFNIFASRRTLAIHMYMLASEGLPNSKNKAYATGVILILLVLIINFLSEYLTKKMGGKN